MTEKEMLEFEFEFTTTNIINALEGEELVTVRKMVKEYFDEHLFADIIGLTEPQEAFIHRENDNVPEDENWELFKKENKEYFLKQLMDENSKYHAIYKAYVILFGFAWNPEMKFDFDELGIDTKALGTD